ncbi:hypothetical protein [Deinococcus enclensis]|uniref:Uncharacterized protein n=1 Tax=Deinococcus enclensis TaxID=1049582 RepID=A0ABT9MF12_9DEIO|nr:hypothetical protein [Deinococcus enclensis]MDP9765183.1 hypothetical protein [Deinococcus enclensis]
MRRCLLLAVLLSACASRELTARTWPAPPGPLHGLELVALDRWSGAGVNGTVDGQVLELRCAARPRWPWPRVRRAYWPGPEWRGEVIWGARQVTYRPPGNWRSIPPVTFTEAEVKRLLRCVLSSSQ